MGIWKCICFKKRNIKRDLHKVKSKASALESKAITLKMAACLSEQLRRLLTKQNTNRSSCFQALLILLLIIQKYVLFRNAESSKRKIILFWFIFRYFFQTAAKHSLFTRCITSVAFSLFQKYRYSF